MLGSIGFAIATRTPRPAQLPQSNLAADACRRRDCVVNATWRALVSALPRRALLEHDGETNPFELIPGKIIACPWRPP